MEDRDVWSPREHARRQRRRALRFMLFGFLLAFVPALIVGFAAGYVGLDEFEFAAVNSTVLWLTIGVSAPISTAGLIAFAMTPPVQDDEPRIEWWHWLVGIVYVALVCLLVGLAFRETFRSGDSASDFDTSDSSAPPVAEPAVSATPPRDGPTVEGLDPDDPRSYSAGVAAVAGVGRSEVVCDIGGFEQYDTGFCTAPEGGGTLRLFRVTAGAPGSPEELYDPTPAAGLHAELEADAGEPLRMMGCRLVPFGDGDPIDFDEVLKAEAGTWAECAGDTGSFYPRWQLVTAGGGNIWWYGTH